ncbi:hypothetical protein [Streptomyces sp. NPDC048644]|uniref:hypothetical protein n=1 Tax=Streptomyces sp. NPDC048644 TaxID=3365582 RepID=UPI00371FF1CA
MTLQALLVPADADKLPARRQLILGRTAELWLWGDPPHRRRSLRHPDQVLRVEGGGIGVYTGAEAEGFRYVIPPDEEPASAFRWEHGEDGRVLGWFDDGEGGLLVSVRNPASSRPAVRVTESAGEQPLPDAPNGLRVYGNYVHDRPPLAAVERLAQAAPIHIRRRSQRASAAGGTDPAVTEEPPRIGQRPFSERVGLLRKAPATDKQR